MTERVGSSHALAEKIREASKSGDVVQSLLQTDERVLARITDGIYRQPASAMRELIANAYDADANHVVISMDPPRFDSISVRDDGNGMSIDTLAHILEHIGGSLKRTTSGAGLDVTSKESSDLSPGGRKLIGKIGIGLFSVAQLTTHFQIITKTRGEAERRVADIVLSSEALGNSEVAETSLTSGSVRIWSVPAADTEGHGTEIVLFKLRPQTRDLLQSRSRWAAVYPSDEARQSNWMPTDTIAPAFHIGGIDFSNQNVIEIPAKLPWVESDLPAVKFERLVEGVRAQTKSYPNPELAIVLDNYLRLVWSLATALPSRYVKGHPFDLTSQSELRFFKLSNSPKGQATDLELGAGGVREVAQLEAPIHFEDETFEVLIDGISISRPLVFSRAVESSNSVARDLVFVGKCEPDLSSIPVEFRGGRLAFEAYLYWSNKVVPKEHNGVLVRIKGASGTLFDSTFMGYQVSEQTRLKQLTAEIFVSEGLENALNIDRESFNYANIHYQYVSRWLHGAIRQFANRHKALSSEALQARRLETRGQQETKLRTVSEDAWTRSPIYSGETIPEVEFATSPDELESRRRSTGMLAFSAQGVLAPLATELGVPTLGAQFVDTLRAVAVIMEGHGLLRNLDYSQQEQVIRDIGRALIASGFR